MAYALTNTTVAADFATSTSTSTPRSQKAAISAPRKSWVTRFFNALHESRMRQAERVIRRHSHLMRDSNAFKNEISTDSLPFGR